MQFLLNKNTNLLILLQYISSQPELLQALVFVLLHGGDALEPGVEGDLLASQHHGIRAESRLELGKESARKRTSAKSICLLKS